jgi:hypothetical protein
MKNIFFLVGATLLLSCEQPQDNTSQLKEEIRTLKTKLDNAYKPGFGEFMGNIQVHHSKLWFAGINENWKLAEFEIHEIEEALVDIQKFNSDRSESQSIGMINPAMDSVSSAIMQRNLSLFKGSFNALTNTCNSCHKATAHEFNVITIPTTPPFSNQNFMPVK